MRAASPSVAVAAILVATLTACVAPRAAPTSGSLLASPSAPVPVAAPQDLPFRLGLDDPPIGKVWQVWGEIAYRNFLEEDADGGIESNPLRYAVATGPIIPTRWGQALVPALFFAWSFVETDDADGGWRVISPGVGFRYFVLAQSWADLYVQVDVAYTRWRYSGDGFFTTGREPDDSTGRELGAGVGGDLFVTDWLGFGASATYRSFRGSGDFDTTSIDGTLQVALRF